MILIKTDNFVEIDIILDGKKIGTAEIEPNKCMLERFVIFEPYQNRGYGQKALNLLKKRYNIKSLWVKSDNAKAIHIYEKAGFKRGKETMFEIEMQAE